MVVRVEEPEIVKLQIRVRISVPSTELVRSTTRAES